jgi:hypothetical protein
MHWRSFSVIKFDVVDKIIKSASEYTYAMSLSAYLDWVPTQLFSFLFRTRSRAPEKRRALCSMLTFNALGS